jgi:hypothetical protein
MLTLLPVADNIYIGYHTDVTDFYEIEPKSPKEIYGAKYHIG